MSAPSMDPNRKTPNIENPRPDQQQKTPQKKEPKGFFGNMLDSVKDFFNEPGKEYKNIEKPKPLGTDEARAQQQQQMAKNLAKEISSSKKPLPSEINRQAKTPDENLGLQDFHMMDSPAERSQPSVNASRPLPSFPQRKMEGVQDELSMKLREITEKKVNPDLYKMKQQVLNVLDMVDKKIDEALARGENPQNLKILFDDQERTPKYVIDNLLSRPAISKIISNHPDLNDAYAELKLKIYSFEK